MWIEEFYPGPPISEEESRQHIAEMKEVGRKYKAWLEERGEVICQLWSIHDRDRPIVHQFCSLHVDEQKRQEFHERYNAALPKEAPSVYYALARDRNFQLAATYHCRVDAITYTRIKNSDIGLWCATIPVATTDAIAFIPRSDFMPLS
ncbi:MAG: hypothetical protein AAB582_03785 [Patescibacteria group bacterium]